MELMTKIDIPKSEWQITPDSKLVLFGSCFADEVGQMMKRGGFDVLVNPFGTLYNPASIAALIGKSLSGREYDGLSSEIFHDEKMGVWHSWMHHSSFSSSSREELIGEMNAAMHKTAERVREADVMIVTLGTSIVYRLKADDMLVANCHKQLDSLFVRHRLSPSDIVCQWTALLQQMRSMNPKLKVIFTVSPIRHKRDGMHVNQISKGILLQAVDDIVSADEFKDFCCYFPSYEIMMDELRDYRFYADDMVHPSDKAVAYIWERFQYTYLNNKTMDFVAKSTKEWARSLHRDIVRKV